MKFLSIAVAALLLDSTSAIVLKGKDDCNGKWCNKGLSYDFDEKPLRAAESDNTRKTQSFEGAKRAHDLAKAEHEAAVAKAAATEAADTEAGAEKSKARADLTSTSHLDPSYESNEKAYEKSVYKKWSTYDAKLKAKDNEVEKSHILNRKERDLDAATASKSKSDANLKSNQDRVTWEKDQLVKGEDQDRLKFVREDHIVQKSIIDGKHDEREGSNGRLLKTLAS